MASSRDERILLASVLAIIRDESLPRSRPRTILFDRGALEYGHALGRAVRRSRRANEGLVRNPYQRTPRVSTYRFHRLARRAGTFVLVGTRTAIALAYVAPRMIGVARHRRRMRGRSRRMPRAELRARNFEILGDWIVTYTRGGHPLRFERRDVDGHEELLFVIEDTEVFAAIVSGPPLAPGGGSQRGAA